MIRSNLGVDGFSAVILPAQPQVRSDPGQRAGQEQLLDGKLSGNYNNGMPFTLTLGCCSWGGNSTTENSHWKHYLNVTWVSKPILPVVPDEEAIFGGYWDKFGK